MSPHAEMPASTEEYPRKADLRKELSKPLPFIAPGTVDPASMAGDQASVQAQSVVDAVNRAIDAGDAKGLAACFYSGQAYWRDLLALTWHLRTFEDGDQISTALLETKSLRGFDGGFKRLGEAKFIPATPVLQFIDCRLTFSTTSPGAACKGRLMLLPVKSADESGKDTLTWKIWIMSTWVSDLDLQPEDEKLLSAPSRDLDGDRIETDVLIIGGGNSGITLAARLKALGIDYLVVEKSPHLGDNWKNRYDCLSFHLPTSACELPFMPYNKELYAPNFLKKTDLVEALRRYADTFHLNMIHSATLQSSLFDEATKRWTVRVETPTGQRTIVCKELVQATGIGTEEPNMPPMEDSQLYSGISVHSKDYRNAKLLAEKGVKTVAVIGSADTAMDIIEDCHSAGLQTTMIVRSPTYVLHVSHAHDSHGMGAYDQMPVKVADEMFMTMPLSVDGMLIRALFGHLASVDQDRYKALAATGFPMLDARDPEFNLYHNLIERRGGLHLDIGKGVNLISEGKVGVRGNVTATAYTPTGIRLSDGSTVDADAVVWCTGFAGLDAKSIVTGILGNSSTDTPDNVLGPKDVAERLDATWGVDNEAEIRGLWKRHLRMEHYWIMAGNAQHHRWYSRILAQQIKLAVHGSLPPAYRETPGSVKAA